MFLTLLAFVFVFGILVLAHETGHFLVAKLSGVKVEEFSIGFPPRIASFRRGETKYTIGAIPMGGYVAMLGENEKSKDKRAYNNQSVGKRFMIGVAGVAVNFLLAWLILTAGFAYGMTPLATPSSEVGGGTIVKPQIFIAEVRKDSPAQKAGIQAGDLIISGSNNESVVFNSAADLKSFTLGNQGKTVKLSLKRENEFIQKDVTISDNVDAPLGVSLVEQSVVKVAWYRAPIAALTETANITRLTFDFLGSFVRKLFSQGQISDAVGGPIAIYTMSGQAARAGLLILLQFVALLSINLGLINILPFPALDGGRALFIVLEKIFRKRIVREEIENIIHMVGFALLILLAVAVTYKDIVRLIK